MKAYLKNYRQSPRKVRLVADLIKGKPVSQALIILDTTPKRATTQLKKLVESAVANAKAKSVGTDTLIIKEIRVDKGITMHRFMPKAHGRASRFDKHSSNVILTLAEANGAVKRETAATEVLKEKKVVKKVTKPKVAAKKTK